MFINIKSALIGINELHMYKFLHPFAIARIILSDSKEFNFTIYAITPDDRDNHHATSYWWTLEKLTGNKLVNLNGRGNWIDQELNLGKNNIYLICRDFKSAAESDLMCRQFFSSKYNLKTSILLNDINDVYIYKFVNNIRILPGLPGKYSANVIL